MNVSDEFTQLIRDTLSPILENDEITNGDIALLIQNASDEMLGKLMVKSIEVAKGAGGAVSVAFVTMFISGAMYGYQKGIRS